LPGTWCSPRSAPPALSFVLCGNDFNGNDSDGNAQNARSRLN
jgi:hypothetical protein